MTNERKTDSDQADKGRNLPIRALVSGKLPDSLEKEMNQNKANIRRDIGRVRSLLVVIFGIFTVCLGQLFLIQIVEGSTLAQEAINNRTFRDIIPAKRGNILDRNGKVLATSIEVYDLAVNQNQVKQYVDERTYDRNGVLITSKNKQELGDPRNRNVIEGYGAEAAAKRLAPLLNVSAAQLGGKLVGNRGFVYLVKGIRPELYREIMKMRINGITGEKRYIRAYPNGSLASTVLGFTNVENKGLAGIELTQDKVLGGVAGKKEVEVSSSGQVIPGGYEVSQEAQPGKSIKLTIDSDIQAVAENALNKQLAKAGGDWGAAVVQDIRTGEVLALADSGNKPPYENRNSNDSFKGSRAIQYAFEPGSTGKTITMAVALSDNKVKPTSLIPSPYSLVMNNETIHDAADHGLWNLSAAGVLVRSSNTGIVQIGSRVTDKERYDLMRSLGIGQKTGIELPGETPGLLVPPEKWDRRSKLTTMFGQSYSVNSVQLTSMFATYAADGVYHAPRIVLGTESEQGVFSPNKPITPRKVIDANVASTLVKMMRGVVAPEGYAAQAQIDGYWSAGKTGTAEIINKSGKITGTITTFGAIAPADNPRIAVSVVVYNPTKIRYGGAVCGPIYKEVAEFILKRLGIPPNTGKEEMYPTFLDKS